MLLAMTVTGCSVPKEVTYFQDTDNATIIENVERNPIKVRPGDKLSIVVKTDRSDLSDLFNLPAYSSRIGNGGSTNGTGAEMRSYSGPSQEGIASYTVNEAGDIDFPQLGSIHVAGMTRGELAGYIKGEIEGRDLAKNPTVLVEFLSSGVNVMGEVMKPGRYDINKDYLTILDAISLAGDLTITGERKNVKVLREQDGKINTYVVDLTNAAEMAKSPAYYMQQGDIIYVEPNTMRKRSTTVNGNNALSVSFWVSVASLLTSVVTTIAVFVNK